MSFFDKIEDVPQPIVDFYKVETRNEPTGNMNEEQYEYQDEEGNTQTSTRLVPEYHDVDYVVQVSVGEFKSLDDVWRVANLHRGKRDDLIRQFLAMVCNATQWRFHDEYIDWLVDEPDIDDNQYYQYDESETLKFSQELYDAAIQKWKDSEPVRPAKLDIEQWFFDNYYPLREAAYPPKEKQLEMQFDDQKHGTNTWFDSIEAVKLQYPQSI